MLSFEIGQRESGFYSERTDRQTESPNHPVPYYHIDNTRNRNQLVLPLTRKSDTQAVFLFRGIKEWNNLTEDILTYSSRLLKRKLRKYYV